MVNNLIALDKEWIHKDFEFNDEKVRQEAEEYKSIMEKQCSDLLDNFLSLI